MGRAITIDVGWLRFAAWAFICLLILGAAVGGAALLILLGPKAPKGESKESYPTVRVEEAVVTTVQIMLDSQGEVVPRRRTSMTAEVIGKLTEVNRAFEAGETIEEGELLLQIDGADYEAALAVANSKLAEAELALQMEEARKTQALRDWEKLGNGRKPSDLVKRVPQLASARAHILAAQASVDKASRDLERTEIRAPYSCRIERTYVDYGAVVSPGMPLVDLVSRGAVEVRLPLSLEDYGYLKRDREGEVEDVEVTAEGSLGGKTVQWRGILLRSEEMVERSTRSINVVAEFDEPDVPPIGMFVKARITGIVVPEVVKVPRAAMLNGSEVLLVKDGRLEFRAVEVMRTEREVVIVRKGLRGGEQIVTTPPNAPLPGGRVEVLDGKEKEAGEAPGEDAPEEGPDGNAEEPE
jgi:RND family efflux transporter MFP subunit